MVQLFRLSLMDLPVSLSLSNFWCFGFVLSFLIIIQVVSGIVLSFMYIPSPDKAFHVVFNVMGDEFFGWIMRYTHILGVSFIFIAMYIHIGRSLYYSSYFKGAVWHVGFCLYLLMMLEAFLGYILPWHQMSYWAATVLSSIVMSIPFVGDTLYLYCVGDLSVSGGILSRVYSVHIWLAFIILFVIIVHLFYLHSGGSNNPLGVTESYTDVVRFHMFFTWKDSLISCSVLTSLLLFLWWSPYLFLDSESFIMANPLVTPENIKPEWYFLPFYAMLRSVNSKIGGLFVVLYFLFILWYPSRNLFCTHCELRQILFWIMCGTFILLGYVGGCHLEYPYPIIGKLGVAVLITCLTAFKTRWTTQANVMIIVMLEYFRVHGAANGFAYW